jgi:hypothetical protein
MLSTGSAVLAEAWPELPFVSQLRAEALSMTTVLSGGAS